MNVHRLNVLLLSFLLTLSPATAQWQVPNHSVPAGRGVGVTGFGSIPPGSAGLPLVSNGPAADVSFQPLPNAGLQPGTDGTAKASSGGTVLDILISTLLNTACTIAPTVCVSLLGYANPQWWGACTGGTNDTTAFQAAVTAAAGSELRIPGKNNGLPVCTINAHLTVSAPMRITGVNREASIIKQTGKDYFFNLLSDGVTIENLWLLGTDAYTSWTGSNIGLIAVNGNNDTVLRHLKASAVNATYWLLGTQSSSTTNVTLDDIWIISTAADVPTDPVHGNNTNFGIVFFSGSSGVRWNGLTITKVRIDGAGLCFGVTLFSTYFDFQVIDSRIIDIGGTNPNTHCTNDLSATNVYGVLVYNAISDGNPPQRGLIARNIITNPLASGIYVAGDGSSAAVPRGNNSSKLSIVGNTVTGQSATDALLPRAAIAVGQTTDVAVLSNHLYNNATCVDMEVQNSGDVMIAGNDCVSVVGGSVGVKMIGGPNGSSNTDRRTVAANLVDVGATGVLLQSGVSAQFNAVSITGNDITAGTPVSVGGNFFSEMLSMQANRLRGNPLWSASSVTGRFSFMDTTFYEAGTGNTGIPFSLLPTASDSSMVFVRDATPGSSPCTGGGTGSLAIHESGAWKC